MKKKILISACLGGAAFLASGAAAVFYMIAAQNGFNLAIDHFDSVPAVTALVCAFIAGAVLSAASGLFLCRTEVSAHGGAYHSASITAYVLTGALILASGVYGVIKILTTAAPNEITRDYVTSVATPILAIIASFYFILAAGRQKTETARSFLGIAAILWGIIGTLDVYFRTGEPINSATKAILLVVSIAGLLFVTEDVRFPLGVEKKSAAYRTFSLFCVCAGTAFALPNFIFALSRVSGEAVFFTAAPQTDLLPSLVGVALAVCAFIRAVTITPHLSELGAPKHDERNSADRSGSTVE